MATAVSDFAKRLDAAALRVRDGHAPRAAVSAAALRVKLAALAELRRAVPSGRLRNLRNARLTVGYDVVGTTKPTALVLAKGPWPIVESGTKPHVIVPKKLGKGGRGKVAKHNSKQALYDALFGGNTAGSFTGQKPMKTPYGPRFSVQHPGTQGKHPWAKAVAAEAVKSPPSMAQAALAEIRKALRA